MPLNLELKIKVVSHSRLEKILKTNYAKFEGTLIQKDIYYKIKQGLLKLRIENGKHTLIKYSRDESGKRWSNYELLELAGKNPAKYLEDILTVETIVDKKRKLYLYENTRIHLDDVKGLGKYLELETLLVDDKKNATKRFEHVKKMLGIENVQQIRASYKNLLSAK